MPKLGPQCRERSKHSTGPAGLALHPSQFLGSAKCQGAQRAWAHNMEQEGLGHAFPVFTVMGGGGTRSARDARSTKQGQESFLE